MQHDPRRRQDQVPPETTWATHLLRAMDEEELVDAAKLVKELVAHPGWEFLSGFLEKFEEATIAEPLNTGTILSHNEYVDVFGRVQGVRFALRLPEAVAVVAAQVEEKLKREAAEAARETS